MHRCWLLRTRICLPGSHRSRPGCWRRSGNRPASVEGDGASGGKAMLFDGQGAPRNGRKCGFGVRHGRVAADTALARMLREGGGFVFWRVVWISSERFRKDRWRWMARRVGLERGRGRFRFGLSLAGSAKRSATLRGRMGSCFRGGGRWGDAILRSAGAPGAETRPGRGRRSIAAPPRCGYFG